MRTFSALFLLAFCFVNYAVAQDNPSAEQLVQAAHRLADLSQNGPYVLTATVVVNAGTPGRETSGHLTIYRDHDHSRVELAMPGYSEVRVAVGDKHYIARGQYLLFASHLESFDQSWEPLQREDPLFPPINVWYGPPRKELLNGTEAWCFDQHTRPEGQRKTAVCVGASQPVLLERDGAGKVEFFDYIAACKSMFPRRVVIHKTGMADMELKDVTVTFQPVENTVFGVPADSIQLERCDSIQPPKAIHTPEPEFPEKARKSRHEAMVVLYTLIGTEGKVDFVKALSSGTEGFEKNAEAGVRKWKFKPATCAGHPVTTEMMAEIQFHLF